MCEQKTNEISFSFKDGILKHTTPAVDPCVGNLEKARMIKKKEFIFMNLTNSGVKKPRSSLKRFFASTVSSLYIALDNCRSLTSSGTSSPRASQRTSTTSMESFSTAIWVNDLSLSTSALGSTLTVSNQFLVLIGIMTNPVSNKRLTTPLLSSWTASC